MKRIFQTIALVLCFSIVSCTNPSEQINDLKSRADRLASDIESLNATASALTQLLSIKNVHETLESFEPITDSDGITYGFKLTFTSGEELVICNTAYPVLPQEESVAPQFKVENGNMFSSFDGGETWAEVGSTGNILITEVSESTDAVRIVLFNGQIITLQKKQKHQFNLKIGTVPESITAGTTVSVPYKLEGYISGLTVRAVAPAGWTVKVTEQSKTSGLIEITAPEEIYEAAVTVVVDDSDGKAVSQTITFQQYKDLKRTLEPVTETLYAEYSESTISVSIKSDVTYNIEVDAAAQDWIKPAATKAVRTDQLPFTVKENTSGRERSGKITFRSGIYSTSVMVIQDANYLEEVYQPLRLRTSSSYRNQMEISYSGDVATLVTTGTDPFINTQALTATLPAEALMLTFEYMCDTEINDLQIFFRPPLSEKYSTHEGALSATGGKWKEVSYPINVERLNYSYWGSKGDYLRMDFGSQPDITIKVRNIHFRNATSAELRAMSSRDKKTTLKEETNQNIKSYLERDFLSEITSVEVDAETITVKGHCNGTEGYYLAEIPPYEIACDMDYFEHKIPIEERDFEITVDRYFDRTEHLEADLLLSSWAVIRETESGEALASNARYADQIECRDTPPAPVYKSRKGLAGYGGYSLQTADLDELQASSVTINIPVDYFISQTSTSFHNDYCGKRYYYTHIPELDIMLRQCYARNIVVAAIILIQRKGVNLVHPECTGGNYSMPDLTTQESVNQYAAFLDYFANRYGKQDGRYGLIYKWIMHNEVDMATTWTNMGVQPLYRYMDSYYRSMRICHNVARCYNEYAEAMGSFTQNWTANLDYSPKEMLDILLKYSEKEGDFQWGVAYHPYPQSLTEPRTWNDTKATYSMNTEYITFKNLEVIDKWIKMPENLYRHTTKRGLWLSENGANSPSYSDGDLANQAACAAWALYKVSQLDGIDAITWHNWSDHPEEGAKLGLRKSSDDGYEAKPVFYVYKAGMTDNWEEAFAPYLDVIGISSWQEIMHTVE